MTRVNAGLDKVLSVLTAIAVVAMMLHVVLHALMRFFLNSPLYGTNEIVSYWYLPVVALLGIPAAHLQNEHITVVLLVENLSKKIRNIFMVFACFMAALVSIGFMIYGFREAMDKMGMGATAGVTDIITWPVYFLVPLVFFVMAALYILEIIVVFRTGDPDIDVRTGEKLESDPIEEAAL
ncbi:TRAP transporter small permease [Brevibacterium yomogidense]|uniref:TRAP transporter small permease n=1 Tax=Brevibacterium yomogidense TaxID=946573 RepID=UPI001E2AAE2B|nr:TRAP transporter small permease [Brevibacterium yomogidense]